MYRLARFYLLCFCVLLFLGCTAHKTSEVQRQENYQLALLNRIFTRLTFAAIENPDVENIDKLLEIFNLKNMKEKYVFSKKLQNFWVSPNLKEWQKLDTASTNIAIFCTFNLGRNSKKTLAFTFAGRTIRSFDLVLDMDSFTQTQLFEYSLSLAE